MKRDLHRFRRRRRRRMQMAIAFTVAVLGALVLVAMRSCTDRMDGMYQDGGKSTSQPLERDKEHLKKLLEKGG